MLSPISIIRDSVVLSLQPKILQTSQSYSIYLRKYQKFFFYIELTVQFAISVQSG